MLVACDRNHAGSLPPVATVEKSDGRIGVCEIVCGCNSSRSQGISGTAQAGGGKASDASRGSRRTCACLSMPVLIATKRETRLQEVRPPATMGAGMRERFAGAAPKDHPGYGAKMDYVNSKPFPSLRVFDVAGGWSERVVGRAVRRTWRKARSVGLTLGVSGSGVALALLAWTVAKTVPGRGWKRGKRLAAWPPAVLPLSLFNTLITVP
jgi:hypothetical protein